MTSIKRQNSPVLSLKSEYNCQIESKIKFRPAYSIVLLQSDVFHRNINGNKDDKNFGMQFHVTYTEFPF